MEQDEVYHITTKSIADYVIFNNEAEYSRIKQLIQYYRVDNVTAKYSYFIARQRGENELVNEKSYQGENELVRIIAYCFMPTHIHLILQQLKESGISIYMNKVLNSYTRYFNTRHHRKGPLWTGRFKRVLVETNEQLLHLTRYIHLNPVTAYLVDRPEDWQFSSYYEYLAEGLIKDKMCEFKHALEISPVEYKKFVEDQISYQRKLSAIKKITLE